jgi:hypothetical protein
MKAGMIILPDEVANKEDLVKSIQAAIRPRSPAEGNYRHYVQQGLDNETARELSGWYGESSDPVEAATARIRYAGTHEDPADRVKFVAATETAGSMRRVGEAAGAAVGSALGLGVLRVATEHSAKLVFGGTMLAGGVVAVIGGQVVASTIGKVASALFVLNVATATGLLAWSLARRR